MVKALKDEQEEEKHFTQKDKRPSFLELTLHLRLQSHLNQADKSFQHQGKGFGQIYLAARSRKKCLCKK